MKIAIIGLGLIGSSIARGLSGKGYYIIGYNRDRRTVEQAMSMNIINEGAGNIIDCVVADLIVIATPLSAYEGIVRDMLPVLTAGKIITDVGSVKTAAIFAVQRNLPRNISFVPGHPVAGSQRTGIEAGSEDLFKEKLVVLTPLPKTPKEDVEKVQKMWQDLGANIEIMTASEHDKIYASVSHAVQLIAYATMLAITDRRANFEVDLSEDFAKFIRLGGSDTKMWTDIFMMNKENIFVFLTSFFNALTKLDNYTNAISLRTQLGGKQRSPLIITNPLNFVFPAVVGNALLKTIKPENYLHYAGSGLRDFTTYSLYDPKVVKEQAVNCTEELKVLAALLHRKIFEITVAIESGSAEILEEKLSEARRKYQEIV